MYCFARDGAWRPAIVRNRHLRHILAAEPDHTTPLDLTAYNLVGMRDAGSAALSNAGMERTRGVDDQRGTSIR